MFKHPEDSRRMEFTSAMPEDLQKVLDELPRVYTPELYQVKCDTIYAHVFDSYPGEGQSVYA